MRALAVLAVVAVLAGCSSTPEPERGTRKPLTNRAGTRLPPGTPPIGSILSSTPVCGASVEDTRRPGTMRCASCGSPTDARGACGCNNYGMPGVGIEPASRVRRSTSPR